LEVKTNIEIYNKQLPEGKIIGIFHFSIPGGTLEVNISSYGRAHFFFSGRGNQTAQYNE